MAKEALRALYFFRKPFLVPDRAKPAFDWHTVSMENFGQTFLRLCSLILDIFRHEPRMLELEDPVYLLGE